jgi:hypothetical protein
MKCKRCHRNIEKVVGRWYHILIKIGNNKRYYINCDYLTSDIGDYNYNELAEPDYRKQKLERILK